MNNSLNLKSVSDISSVYTWCLEIHQTKGISNLNVVLVQYWNLWVLVMVTSFTVLVLIFRKQVLNQVCTLPINSTLALLGQCALHKFTFPFHFQIISTSSTNVNTSHSHTSHVPRSSNAAVNVSRGCVNTEPTTLGGDMPGRDWSPNDVGSISALPWSGVSSSSKFCVLSTESKTPKQLILAELFHIYRINCSSASDVCIGNNLMPCTNTDCSMLITYLCNRNTSR